MQQVSAENENVFKSSIIFFLNQVDDKLFKNAREMNK